MSCNDSEKENSIIGDHFGGNYLETGMIYFNQSWGQENTGYDRPVYINVPSSSSGPYNIIIVLHGGGGNAQQFICLLYTSPSPRDRQKSRMPSSA